MSTRSYNYSSLSAAYQCQTLYRYQYIDRAKPQFDQTGDLAFGSAIHFALENYLADEDDPVQSFEVYWNNEKKKNLQYGRFNHDALADMGVVLLERFIRLHAKKLHPEHIESRLYGTMGLDATIQIEGTPDVIGSFEGVPSIIDFKTSGTRYHKLKPLLSEQMALYSHLYRPKDIFQFVYIVFVKGTTPTIQIVKHLPTQAELDTLLRNIYHQILGLEKKAIDKEVYTRNTQACIRGEIICPFFKNCWEGK